MGLIFQSEEELPRRNPAVKFCPWFPRRSPAINPEPKARACDSRVRLGSAAPAKGARIFR